MKLQLQSTTPTHDTPATAPAPLSADQLRFVAGGLPYHGFTEPPEANTTSGPDTDLPYHGF